MQPQENENDRQIPQIDNGYPPVQPEQTSSQQPQIYQPQQPQNYSPEQQTPYSSNPSPTPPVDQPQNFTSTPQSYVPPQQPTPTQYQPQPNLQPQAPQAVTYAHPIQASAKSDKSFIGTFILSWLLGSFGADRFYTGKIVTAILKLITFGGFGIWATIDLILVCFGKFKDKQGRPLDGYEEHKGWAKIAGVILAIFNLITGLIVGGILLALILTSSSGIQNKARDTERQTDINSINEELVAYNTQTGVYPSIAQMNDRTWTAQNLPNLNPENFKDPNGTDDKFGVNNINSYSYIAATRDGAECDGATVKCDAFTLQANLEQGTTYVKQSLTY